LLGFSYPYKDGMAEEWIATHRPAYEAGERVTWAVVLREEEALVGSITLHHLQPIHDSAELGYWLGRPYWGRGYATEAGREVVRYGFEDLGLHRIGASHLGSNLASGKVMNLLLAVNPKTGELRWRWIESWIERMSQEHIKAVLSESNLDGLIWDKAPSHRAKSLEGARRHREGPDPRNAANGGAPDPRGRP
jgi:hypothetical protein